MNSIATTDQCDRYRKNDVLDRSPHPSLELLRIRDCGITHRRRRRSGHFGSRSIDHNRRRIGRRRSGSHRIDQNGRRVGRRQSAVRRHRQEHVVREPTLVGARTTNMHPAVFTTGYRGPIRQGHRGVTTVPPDHQGIGSGSILKAALQQSSFLVPGIKSVPENRPVGCRISDPRSEP